MSRGSADYGIPDYSFFTVETPIGDVVAERQGFARLDNRGRVVWSEDFRSGLARWERTKNGTGALPVHVVGTQLSIGYHGAIMLDPLVNGGISMMIANMILPVSKRLGVEFSIYLPTNFCEVEVELVHSYTGNAAYYGKLDILPDTGTVRLIGQNQSTTLFTPSSLGYIRGRWTTYKFVLDVENNTYERAMIGNTQYNVGSTTLQSFGAEITGYTQIFARATGYNAALIEPFYLGNVFISVDEP